MIQVVTVQDPMKDAKALMAQLVSSQTKARQTVLETKHIPASAPIVTQLDSLASGMEMAYEKLHEVASLQKQAGGPAFAKVKEVAQKLLETYHDKSAYAKALLNVKKRKDAQAEAKDTDSAAVLALTDQ